MLENDDSYLQTKFGKYIISNIFQNNPILKPRDYTNPNPNFESLPYPGGGGRFDFFFFLSFVVDHILYVCFSALFS